MHIEIHGRQDADAPTLVFSSGLGGAAHFWAPQLSSLGKDFRIVLYDQLGTGHSPAELPEGYAIGDMANELQRLLAEYHIGDYHLVGHALGGLVGLELALQKAPGLKSLTLMNAWAKASPHTARCFSVRKQLLAGAGAAAYIEAQALFLYPPTWIAEHIEHLEVEECKQLAGFPPVENLLRRIQALLTFNPGEALSKVEQPTLLLANSDDSLVPWTCSQELQRVLPNATLKVFDYGGHASSITCAETINTTLADFIHSVAPTTPAA
ncbi:MULTISPECIES: pyrimidine utilization protein D [unclassified Oceanobacter]|uniref:pyrimidine utilization protein D n=2 Tax=Gammaproteobacteria TaxID=1236 RepID=UPI002735B2C5|nr:MULTISPECIES: pyrimidine utilization protein D [unclassified Oceanobacter]MDP2506939.1 pyrimidine utilization protein D [Oceanobacter sp. 3_MG-2023]MDP2608490.1 pyrimidine utilization protein D [Oceanobacter sp. 1_MG-2023]MDP2611585.1 pyrimidine utilization protein D [Oceanobacter sp. 2_MG-2023]